MSQAQGIFEVMRVTTIFASPGAGKTTQITERFIAGVQSGLEPGQILVIAASREAANSLRDNLAIALQGATPGSLAKTISSFAYGILRYKAITMGQSSPELISGSEQDQILEQIISSSVNQIPAAQSNWPKHINAQVMSLTGFRAELRDLITACLEHAVTPENLKQLGISHNKTEWVAAAEMFDQYLSVVTGPDFNNRFDPTLILRKAAEELSALAEWPEQIKLILVDDAQELTPAAANLIKVATSRGAELVLVGDPDASTLGFRAADPRAMKNLAEEIAATNSVSVEEIFLQPSHAIRTPAISKVLSLVSAQIDTARAGRQRKGLNPDTKVLEQDRLGLEGHLFTQPGAEPAWLAKRLREIHLYENVAWNEIAVVARSREALAKLALELAHESVPIEIAGTNQALRDEFGSKTLLQVAQLLFEDQVIDSSLAITLLTSPLCGLDSLGLRRIRRALRREELLNDGTKNSDELLAELFKSPGSATTIKSKEGRQVARFLKNYFEARELATDKSSSIEDVLWSLWNSSGLAKSWSDLSRGVGEVAVQANKNLDAVVSLFAAANRFVERNPDGEAKVFISQQLAQALPEDTLALNNKVGSAIRLLTPSGLIGNRFRVVALPQMIEGVWPNLRPRSSLLGATSLDALLSKRVIDLNQPQQSELPNELRMLHKAVGAASERLLVTATETDDSQASQFFRLILGEVPKPSLHPGSRLTLRGMAATLRKQLVLNESESDNQSAALGLVRLANAKVPGANPDNWYGLLEVSSSEPLTDLAEKKVVVRPSQLESFIKCPLHWFLNAHGASDTTFSANLGSLVHKALELGTEAQEESLWELVESKWHTLSFESEWLEQAGSRKAKAMIANMVQYLRKFDATGAQVIGRETNFEFELGSAVIRGQVDRIERYPDGQVMIVDLKTGGKTFTKEEAQNHPQLGLYQLAFENNAFQELIDLPGDSFLGGAKLLLIAGDKPTEREQQAISSSEILRSNFENLVETAAQGMSMNSKVFLANVGSHCSNENEYGSCQIHLTKAVSYVG
jgi:superfamily I DNA/RNA helicase/RecB family exonuclease